MMFSKLNGQLELNKVRNTNISSDELNNIETDLIFGDYVGTLDQVE